MGEHYNSLVKVFESTDVPKFKELKDKMTSLLMGDGNLGLANQVEAELLPHKVRKLAKVYETIPLNKLANKLGLETVDEAESLILSMSFRQSESSKGSFRVKINQEEGIVYFIQDDDKFSSLLDDDSLLNSSQISQDLTKQITQCINFANRIRDLDVILSTSQSFQALRKDATYQSWAKKETLTRSQPQQPRSVAELGSTSR